MSYYTELTNEQIQPNGPNTLQVAKIGDLLYYFINKHFVYCSEMETKDDGNKFGFTVPPYGIVYLDNLLISVKNAMSKSIQLNANKEISVEIIDVEPLHLNKITK